MNVVKIKRYPSAFDKSDEDQELLSVQIEMISMPFYLLSIEESVSDCRRINIKVDGLRFHVFNALLSKWIRTLIMDPNTKSKSIGLINGDPSFYSIDIEYGNVVYFGCFPLMTMAEDCLCAFGFTHKQESKIMSKGRMVSVEGIDGAGKSTMTKFLVNYLREKGYDVIQTREPGGSPLAEKIRGLLLSEKMCPKTEALLFAAARSDHLDTLIKPAIADGKIVISDRFTDSTSAYQGYGRGLHDVVSTLEKLVCDIFEPDYTLFFNITLEESIKRLTARNTDINHFDTEETAFKERVHAGYLARLRVKSHRMVEIDAMQSIGDVEKQIEKWVDEVFVPNNPLAKE